MNRDGLHYLITYTALEESMCINVHGNVTVSLERIGQLSQAV